MSEKKVTQGKAQGILLKFMQQFLANYDAKYALVEDEGMNIQLINNVDDPESPYLSFTINTDVDMGLLPNESPDADIVIASTPPRDNCVEFRVYYDVS